MFFSLPVSMYFPFFTMIIISYLIYKDLQSKNAKGGSLKMRGFILDMEIFFVTVAGMLELRLQALLS